MVSDLVTMSDFEVLVFMKHERTRDKLAEFMGTSFRGAEVRVSRLRKKGLLERDRYAISDKGLDLLRAVRETLVMV